MKTEELQKIAQAAAKHIKTEQALAEFQQMLTKVTVEAALNAELDAHLGYERHDLPVADREVGWRQLQKRLFVENGSDRCWTV